MIWAALTASFKSLVNTVKAALKSAFLPAGDASEEGDGLKHERVVCPTDRTEGSLVEIARAIGVPDKQARKISGVFQSTKDLTEKYYYLPMIFIFILILVLVVCLVFPEILGFGALGPIKGSVAAFIQSVLYGGSVPAGGWFAVLQSYGMSHILPPVLVRLAGTVGIGIVVGAAVSSFRRWRS